MCFNTHLSVVEFRRSSFSSLPGDKQDIVEGKIFSLATTGISDDPIGIQSVLEMAMMRMQSKGLTCTCMHQVSRMSPSHMTSAKKAQ